MTEELTDRKTKVVEEFPVGNNRFRIIGINLKRILDETVIQDLGNELMGYVLPEGVSYGKGVNHNPEVSRPNWGHCLDFSVVDYCSSAVFGKLITMDKYLKANSKRPISLSNVVPSIYEVFKYTQLDKVFSIHENNDKYKGAMGFVPLIQDSSN